MIKIAQIGVGYWGPNILRNFYDIENVEIKKVVDKNPDRREYVKQRYRTIETDEDIDEIIKDKEIDVNSKNQYLGEFDSFDKFQLIKRAGDIIIPKIDFVEPLKSEALHFIECIREKKKPLSDGESGLKVTQIIEAAMESLNNKSIEVKI